MTTYYARILDADTGAEGKYSFEGPANLFSETPVRIVRAFMEHVDRNLLPQKHVDYELNVALKNAEHEVVTAMGAFHFDGGRPGLPFLLMISPKG